MSKLPFELWARIFNFVPKKGLVSLSTTGRQLRTIAQAALYNNVVLTVSSDFGLESDGDGGLGDSLMLLTRSLVKHSRLAGLVHHLTLIAISRPRQETWSHTVSSNGALLQPLSLCPNLCTLQLLEFQVDAELCNILRNRASLRRVRFVSCEIDPRLFGEPISAVSSPTNPDADLTLGGWTFTIPREVESLEFSSSSLGEVLSDLKAHCLLHSLMKLTISGKCSKNIVPFLMCCPQLRHITLPPETIASPPARVVLRSLPKSAIPLLEQFSGEADCMGIFLEGRPVHTVQTGLVVNSPLNVLASLHMSYVPVKSLTIVVDTINLEVFEYFPTTLQFLSVGERIQNLDDVSWVGGFSRMPDLHTFQLRTRAMSRKWQLDIIYAALAACNSLQEFTFKPYRESIGYSDVVLWRSKGGSRQWERYSKRHKHRFPDRPWALYFSIEAKS